MVWKPNNLAAVTGSPTANFDYLGTDGHIRELWWAPPNAWNHNDLTVAASGAPKSISAPTAYVFVEQGTQHVVYTSDSHQIIELAWTSGGAKTTAAVIRTDRLERHDVRSSR
jgi:hypothetical protein